MANAILNGTGLGYDPLRIADEAFLALQSNLVFGGLVHRGLEPRTMGKGSVVNIKKPDTFSVKNGGTFVPEDVNPETIQVPLNQWKSVDFALTDVEVAQADSSIIRDHVINATYALAKYIDADVAALGKDVPWYQDVSSTPTPSDITNCYRILADNNVPVNELNNMHLVMNPTVYTGYMNDQSFSQYQGSGGYGVNTQLTAQLGQRYNFNTAMSQNIQSHTTGTASTTALAVNGALSARATTVNLDAGTVTGTLKKGDVITFAGHTQKYSVTADVTASGNAFTGVGITPPLAVDVADNVVVTLVQDSHSMNLAFHRDAFALVMCPLPQIQDSYVVTEGNMSFRFRIWDEKSIAKRCISVDALYGVKTIDPNKAVRLRG